MDKLFAIAHFRIQPGQGEAFAEAARASMAASKEDLAGTHLFEWFMAPGAEECLVIEAYDGAEGLAHHSRHAGKALPGLMALADNQVTLLGDVPVELGERMALRFPGTRVFGPRLQGLLQAPAPGSAAAQSGSRIFAVARFAIHPGQLERFCALAAECHAIVRANEPGTLAYEWFLDRESMECITIDIYRDAQALGEHMRNAGAAMARILEIVDSRVELYGALPPEMLARLQAGLGVRFVAPQLQGIV